MPPTTKSSGHSVQYNVRPAKQIERRMLVATLQRLGEKGFPIRTYQYTGFGSYFFVDFDLFHRQLGMTDLVSIEHDETLKTRCEFNKPFDCVKMEYGSVSDYIPCLDADKRHILWLDYDRFPDGEMLEDVKSASNQLSTGSIVLFTADTQPSEVDVPTGTSSEIATYLQKEFGEFFDKSLSNDDFGLEERPHTLAKLMATAFEEGIRTRQNAEFLPLFNFTYKDGHRMISAGGMIVSADERERVENSRLHELSFTTNSFEQPPYQITPPVLTRKERIFLDQTMPDGELTHSELGLDTKTAEQYRSVYRYLPIFAELVTS